jgi:hypothetical protein
MIIMAVQRTGRTVSETYRSRYRLPANVALVRFSAVPGGPSAISWSIPFFANQCSSPSLSLRSTEYPSSISVRCARTAFLLPPIPHASQVGDWPSPRGSYRSCPRSPTTAAGHKRRFRGTGDKSARPPIPERLRHCSEPTLRAKRRSRACPRICEMAFQKAYLLRPVGNGFIERFRSPASHTICLRFVRRPGRSPIATRIERERLSVTPGAILCRGIAADVRQRVTGPSRRAFNLYCVVQPRCRLLKSECRDASSRPERQHASAG